MGQGTHLEAQAAAIETAFMQRDILLQEVSSESFITLKEEHPWSVDSQQALGIVGQGTELGKSSQVGLHFC